MDYIKGLVVGFITSVAAYLNPISGEIQGLIALFAINFMAGLVADILIEKDGFSFKKAFHCITEATAFFALICTIYYIGEHKGNAAGALQCISFITYSILWFYGVNILKNLKQIFKPATVAGKVFNFLYYVLSVEFLKKIPYLENYLNTKTNETNK